MFWNDNGHGYELLQCEAHHARKTNVCMLLLFIPMPQLKTKGLNSFSHARHPHAFFFFFIASEIIIIFTGRCNHSFFLGSDAMHCKERYFPFQKIIDFPGFLCHLVDFGICV